MVCKPAPCLMSTYDIYKCLIIMSVKTNVLVSENTKNKMLIKTMGVHSGG